MSRIRSCELGEPARYSELRAYSNPKNFRRLGRSTGSGGGREKGARSSERYRYISVYVNKYASLISHMRVAHRLHSCISIYIEAVSTL